MKKIYKTLCAVFGFLFFAWGAEASAASGSAPRVDFRPDGLYLQNITVEDLKDYYQIYRYNDYIYMPGWIYPPVFLNELPSDYAALKDKTARNRLFIQILAPLTLKLAEELREERFLILETEAFFEKNGAFTPEQEALLESKAKKYDIFTRMKGQRRYELLLKHLLLKVDVVPPSILIAAAAIDTDWGTSRPAQKANNLYKQLVWYTDKGLAPEDEKEDNSYRYEIFPSLYESIKAYALKINSGVNYEHMRFLREEIRSREQPVLGRTLAHAMIFDSSLKNYAGILDYTITYYELTNFDEAQLGGIEIPAVQKGQKND